jgi:hypothetical protein
MFPTWPIVALQSSLTILTSPDGSLICAIPLSLAISCAEEPAERTICAPFPGYSSMLFMNVPSGIFCSGSELPGLISAPAPLSTTSPAFSPCGAII